MMKKSSRIASPVAAGQIIKDDIHWLLVIWIIAIAILNLIISADNLPKGIRFYAMKSNSMSPVVPANSLIITKVYPLYSKNEIITFEFPDNKETVTHRIVNLSKQDNQSYYITKGDNNKLVDRRLIPPKNIFGKVIVVIPLLGWLIKSIKTTLGFIILIGIPTILVIRKEILIIRKELSKKRSK